MATTSHTTPDGLTYTVDTNGFPCTACPACQATGNKPQFSHVANGVCFRCKGAGALYDTRTKAGQYAEQYRALTKTAYVRGCDVTAGMTIRLAPHHGDTGVWSHVVWAKQTSRVLSHDPAYRHVDREVIARYATGSLDRLWGERYEVRADADRVEARRVELVTLARAAHEKALRRRAKALAA